MQGASFSRPGNVEDLDMAPTADSLYHAPYSHSTLGT